MKHKYLLPIFVILLTSQVIAFGVGAPYHSENPLEMPAGTTKDINFNLQNMAGSEDLMVRPALNQGFEVMTINLEDFPVNLGDSININAQVTIPEGTPIGSIYPVEITFTTLTQSSGGPIGLGASVGRRFNIIVIPSLEQKKQIEQRDKLIKNIGIATGIILLTILTWFYLKKKNTNKKKK